ncbi:MAG TPA: hypothetical protein VM143_17210 [Acidimicrobiales bacterium]|nr:hypothetical protein [Acidimicrobiales bacterium]
MASIETSAITDLPTPRDGIAASLAVVLLAGTPVASLLAWVLGLGRFSVWFWRVSAPGVAGLIAVGWWLASRRAGGRLHTAMVAGTIGGLIGTAGYDVFRLPFLIAGYRLLAPIDSYGVLLLGAHGSSPLTGFAGWAYHVSNGVGFGIAYAAVAFGRRWWWGVLWAMTLETATVLTPFVDTYGLRGRWGLIAIAYAAHVFYGLPLGRWVERADARVAELRAETAGRPAVLALVGVGVGLLVWHQPWSVVGRGGDDDGGGAADVRAGRFVPRWLHVAVDDCIEVHNGDGSSYAISGAGAATVALPRRGTATVCFPEPGVHRIRTSAKPDAGGFVIVDEELT